MTSLVLLGALLAPGQMTAAAPQAVVPGGTPASQPVPANPRTIAQDDGLDAIVVRENREETPGVPREQTAAPTSNEPRRRSLPSPWDAPFPGNEYQGYPLIGVPPDNSRWPLQKALQGTWPVDLLDSMRTRVYGWVDSSGNLSTNKHSNLPAGYYIVPNSLQVDQALIRVERSVDTVQTDHVDVGFRSTLLYGIDYRWMVAGGWFSEQLLKHNFLYAYDPTEQYVDVYVPWIAQGMILRVGRWIACPDIETQFAPDNYMGTHSLLFLYDTYTQTGAMLTFKLNDQWTVQGAIHAGTDMAPWYKGAIPTGFFGVRWTAPDNNDAFYTCLNNINGARFRHFWEADNQPSGHDNFNYLVSTWEHRFNKMIHTKTEGYFMWQFNAPLGGTPSLGPPRSFGAGGGLGPPIPGPAFAYGLLNYTMFAFSAKDFITVRNEWWRDEEGERTGFPTTYTSHSIGLTHHFSNNLTFRPELCYYRSWNVPAFDLGTRKNMLMLAFDVYLRF